MLGRYLVDDFPQEIDDSRLRHAGTDEAGREWHEARVVLPAPPDVVDQLTGRPGVMSIMACAAAGGPTGCLLRARRILRRGQAQALQRLAQFDLGVTLRDDSREPRFALAVPTAGPPERVNARHVRGIPADDAGRKPTRLFQPGQSLFAGGGLRMVSSISAPLR